MAAKQETLAKQEASLAKREALFAKREELFEMLLKDKDKRMIFLEMKILSLEGQLTVRGVMEHFVNGYLKPLVIGNKNAHH